MRTLLGPVLPLASGLRFRCAAGTLWGHPGGGGGSFLGSTLSFKATSGFAVVWGVTAVTACAPGEMCVCWEGEDLGLTIGSVPCCSRFFFSFLF